MKKLLKSLLLSSLISAPWTASNFVFGQDSAPAEEAKVVAAPTIAIQPPADDPSFDLMGEFVGNVELGEDSTEPWGLQVRPLGNNRFEARQYKGGLPGQEKFTSTSHALVGNLFGDYLVLSGGPWAVIVEKEHCIILDREGKKLGKLDRIKRTSPTMGAKPPEGAIVLFDGTNTDHFTMAETEDGLLKPGADVIPMFQDFNMHVEFRLAYMPEFEGQARSNSGCYLQSRYEVQVLDSFSELPTFNGCSSLYRQKPADLNMCLPPLEWQTYDIVFTAPRWGSDGKKIRNARITVWQNGVKTQDDYEIMSKTGAGKPEEPTLLPIKFQNHKDPVRFRNIWIIDRGLTAVAEFPIKSEN